MDTRHGQHDRDIDVDIEEAPVRWQWPEEGLEMPVVQNVFRCNEGKSYWAIHMTGVELGIVSVFGLLIQIGATASG